MTKVPVLISHRIYLSYAKYWGQAVEKFKKEVTWTQAKETFCELPISFQCVIGTSPLDTTDEHFRPLTLLRVERKSK